MLKNSSIKSIDLEKNSPIKFPDVAQALLEPNGLLASGGELNPEWLLSAYQQGIFPWYNPDEPILWWSPDPRFGFTPGKVHLSKSRIRQIRKNDWIIRSDSQFESVIRRCANVKRNGQNGTWISEEMILAYTELFHLGYAHSIEVFDDNQLVGGLYGLAIGQMFFAESMFSLNSQASAFALFALSQQLAIWQWPWIDCQIENPHLMLLRGNSIRRVDFMELLAIQLNKPAVSGSWGTLFPCTNLEQYLHMNNI